jgi:hypothetical protein
LGRYQTGQVGNDRPAFFYALISLEANRDRWRDHASEERFRAAEDCETESRVVVAHAEIELQKWVYIERLRRQEAIEEKPKTQPLGERLPKLKSKLKG